MSELVQRVCDVHLAMKYVVASFSEVPPDKRNLVQIMPDAVLCMNEVVQGMCEVAQNGFDVPQTCVIWLKTSA